MTISKAYSFLEREDAIERRPGRPLVVKAMGTTGLQDQRMEQVRQSLAATVTAVRQLDVDAGEAVRLFEEMLREARRTSRVEEDSQ